MKILSTEDTEYLQSFFDDESMIHTMVDDYCVEAIRPFLGKMLLTANGSIVIEPVDGVVFLLTVKTMTITEIHMMVLPHKRGKVAVKAAHDAMKWYFEGSTCEKLVGMVPVYNKAALKFADWVGFEIEGTCKNSYRKDGKLHDQIIFGIEKEKFLCLQQ